MNKSDYQFRIICKVLDVKDVNKIRINKNNRRREIRKNIKRASGSEF